MKDYDPEKMISDSRFTVLFADSDKAMQEKVLSRIGRLVSDNRPYADDKNYGFLCNLFTSHRDTVIVILLLYQFG